MSLTIAEKKRFRRIGHGLKPVVLTGNQGLSEAVLAEADRALEDHELIKVRVNDEDREARAEAMRLLARHCGAETVQVIGKEEGDVVTIQTPAGAVEYEIAEVRYE